MGGKSCETPSLLHAHSPNMHVVIMIVQSRAIEEYERERI